MAKKRFGWAVPKLAAMFVIVSVGVAQQKTSLAPAPGKLVDVGGHKLRIRCVGPLNGQPTVIFEAGGGAFSKDWDGVQSLLASRVRSCAYDRAGLGWSEPGPAPGTLRQEVFELHTLLEAEKISGPLILVGQSIGALNVRLYTERYGRDVAGVVLVDPADESSMVFSLRANRWMRVRDLATGRAVPPARRSGPASTGYRPEDDYLGDEAQLLYLRRKQDPQPLGDRPLFVLAAGKRPPPPGMTEDTYKDIRRAIDQNRVEAAQLSRNSKFLVDPDSGHTIQIEDPKLVAQAVEEVVAAVKGNTRLK
jgi:pimeloyl-ACP methyl ester carboxylesterase